MLWLQNQLIRIESYSFDVVTALSEGIRDSLFGSARRVAAIIPLGANLEHFAPRPVSASISEKLGIPIPKLRRWDQEGVLKAQRSFGGHRDLLHDAALSPDGNFLYVAGDGRVVEVEVVIEVVVVVAESAVAVDVHTKSVGADTPAGNVTAVSPLSADPFHVAVTTDEYPFV